MIDDLLLVVPCYNEAERLDVSAFAEALSGDPTLQFLFVDDGSTDATWQVLQDLQAQAPADRVQLLRLDQNSGKGEAVRRGLLEAFGKGAKLAGYLDADLSVSPAGLMPMRHLMQEHSAVLMAIGSRVRLLGLDIRRRLPRHYAGRIFATAADMVLGLGVYDTQCGAKLLRHDPRVTAILKEPFRSRWIFDVELIARLEATTDELPQTLIREVPLEKWHEVAGSKLRLRDALRAAADLFGIYLQQRRSRRS